MKSSYSSLSSGKVLECFSLDGEYHSKEDVHILQDRLLFLWNRKNNFLNKNYIDIKDICNFYRVFDFKSAKEKWPDIDFETYDFRKKQLRAIINSFRETNININNESIVRIVPQKILSGFLSSETAIINSIIENLKQNEWYEDFCAFLLSDECKTNVLSKMKYKINTVNGLEQIDLQYQSNFRFKSLPGTTSLFTMQKSERKNIVPFPGHKLYSADFRQFEIRTLLNLCSTGIDFSKREIYDDIAKESNLGDDNIKQQIIAYSYGQENKKLESFIDKDEILDRIDGEYFIFNNLPVIVRAEDPDHVKIHTITQTISQYVFLQKLDKILNLLDNRQSKFIFPLHDCVIVSIHPDEEFLMDEIAKILEDDIYKIKQYVGMNFQDMEEI